MDATATNLQPWQDLSENTRELFRNHLPLAAIKELYEALAAHHSFLVRESQLGEDVRERTLRCNALLRGTAEALEDCE